MLGRALEALCHDRLAEPKTGTTAQRTGVKSPRKLSLSQGLQKLRDQGVIDARLFEWSQQLRAFRNLAAHAEESTISRSDVEDLQTFVTAIVEYVYDLAERYEEFKARLKKRRDSAEARG
jgi:uncharacterized protein YutE (UPF0331/DUF86 family)